MFNYMIYIIGLYSWNIKLLTKKCLLVKHYTIKNLGSIKNDEVYSRICRFEDHGMHMVLYAALLIGSFVAVIVLSFFLIYLVLLMP